MLLLQQLIGLLLISFVHGDYCPISFNPPEVVVEYQTLFSVNCSTDMTDNFSLSWEGYNDTVYTDGIPKSVDAIDWEMQLTCYIQFNEMQCSESLSVIVYKTPDSVSISIVNHNGPVIEGNQYELQCDVFNVAPVQNLTVKWYKGQTLVNQTIFTDTINTPVNKTDTLMISPNRADDGVQYRCEAELELGEEGPQPPPKVTSDPLSVEVYYKPQHSSSTETISISNEVTLNCTVKANPAPAYSWDSEHLKEKITSSVLPSSKLSPGEYTCIATNSQGEDSKVFVVRSGGRTTFWAIVITGVAVAALLIISYVIYKCKSSPNSVI